MSGRAVFVTCPPPTPPTSGPTTGTTSPPAAECLQTLADRGWPADDVAVQRDALPRGPEQLSSVPNRRLACRPATTLRQFAEDHRAVWTP